MVNVLDKVQPKTKEQLKQLINYAFKHNIYDLNFIDTSKITNMSNLFINCEYNIDVSNWDVSNVTNMLAMFYCCYDFNCDLSKWDVSNVTNMYSLFRRCNKFTGKGLENWNVSKLKRWENMFDECTKLTCDLSSWQY